MKAIKHTNLKTLTVLAAALLSMASLAIPPQESRAGDGGGGNTKGDEGTEQINKRFNINRTTTENFEFRWSHLFILLIICNDKITFLRLVNNLFSNHE